MKFKTITYSVILVLISTQALASDIAYGTLKGIKIYDHPSQKVIKLYFNADATNQTVAACQGVADITPSQHNESTVQQMLSVAMSAYMAGKKIRAYSSADTCEVDFLAMQETYF